MRYGLIGIVLLWTRLSAQDPCQEFTAWHRANPGAARPLPAYRSALIGRGLSAAEADKRIADLYGGIANCPHFAALHFDGVYRSEKRQFRSEPNAFLVESTKNIKPGRALDVAMGQGRNAVHLAKTGWEVTGFDISLQGLVAAREAAERAGVKVDAVHQGWREFDFGTDKWDLIVLCYAWVPISEPAFVKRLIAGLRPAGLVVFENLLADHSDAAPGEVGWPKPNQLLRLFGSELRILRYEDIETEMDWGNQRNARIARLLAKK